MVLPIDDSLQATAPATVSTAKLPSYDASTYDSSGYTSGIYDATTYDATGYDATTKDLTGDQLVSDNLDKVLDKDGVLMDVARSTGDEYANSRGMLNSSMGAESSMRAMIDSALPIASQDASTQLSQLQTNQGYENQASQFNTAAENQAREYGATAKNRSSEFNIDSQNRASEFTANAENTAGQFNAVSENEAARFAATNEVQQTRDSILQSYQLQMENLSTNNKSLLIDLEQKYARTIQSDKNASEVYRTTMEQIGDIMNNGDLSGTQQIAGTNELISMLGAYLDFNESLLNSNSYDPDASVAGGTTTVNWDKNNQSGDFGIAMESSLYDSILAKYQANPIQFSGYGINSQGQFVNISQSFVGQDGLKYQNNMTFAQSPEGLWVQVTYNG